MISQSPLAAKISAPRPDWFRAATAIATTPSPKLIQDEHAEELGKQLPDDGAPPRGHHTATSASTTAHPWCSSSTMWPRTAAHRGGLEEGTDHVVVRGVAAPVTRDDQIAVGVGERALAPAIGSPA